MIRIVVTADRCEELRQFLNQWSGDILQRPPVLLKDVSDLPRPHGCYMGKHTKKDRSR